MKTRTPCSILAVLALLPSLAAAQAGQTWIVTYDAPPSAAQIEALTGVAQQVHAYHHLPAAAAILSPGDVGLLGNLPGVRGIYPNRQFQWLLDQSTGTIRADGVWADGYTGAGIGVAVIDAGVDGSHPDLCAAAQFCNGNPIKTVQNVKILGRQSYADPVVVLENQISTDSSSGHGSHVAGIAGGAGVAGQTPGQYRGVAHGSNLIGLGTGEVAEVDTVLAAFDWVLANHATYNIKVINNSWGPGAGAQYDPNDPVQVAIGKAYDAGMAVVFGAGNDGPTTGSINIFGANPKAISAAGGTKTGHIALFSSRGVPGHSLLRPTVTTPGMFIASVRARTGFYAWVADASGPDPNDPILPPDDASYAYASGTSMSAPHVSGVVALMQQAAIMNLGRYLTPAEVRNLLQNTAVSNDPVGGPGGLPNYQGYSMGAGYVDALAAVRSIAAGTNLQAYDDSMTEDVRTFKGTVTAAAPTFETTYTVAPGAISLDVMIDWQVAAQDLDIELYRPDGAIAYSTAVCLGVFDFFRAFCLAGAEGPNQYSSTSTNKPNERINVNFPAAGTWRAVVKGTAAASDTAWGMWSVVYPDGTVLAPAPAAATVTVTGPAAPGVAGRTEQVTAQVFDAAGNAVSNATVSWTSAGVGSIVTAETLTDDRGTALATVSADSLGTQTVTATSGSASGSANVTWIGLPQVPVVPPPPANTPGRASGGGHISNPSKKHFAFFAEYTAQSSAPGGDLSFDDKAGTKIKATGMGSFVITNGNKATVKGDASVNGTGGYTFTLEVVDNGEPGSADTFKLMVTGSMYSYETQGTLSGGNIQVQAY